MAATLAPVTCRVDSSNTMAQVTASLSPSKKRSRAMREHAGLLAKTGSGKRICVEHVGDDKTVAFFLDRPYTTIITHHDSAKDFIETEKIHNDIIKEAAEQYSALKNELVAVRTELVNTTTTADNEKRSHEAAMARLKTEAETYKQGVDSQNAHDVSNGRSEGDLIKQDAHHVEEQLKMQLASASEENAELKHYASGNKERYEKLEQQYKLEITAARDENSRIRLGAEQLKEQYETHAAKLQAEKERFVKQAEQAEKQHKSQLAAAQEEGGRVNHQVEQLKQHYETQLDELRQENGRITQLKGQSEAHYRTQLFEAQEMSGRISQDATQTIERLREEFSTNSQKVYDLEQQMLSSSDEYQGMQSQLATQQEGNRQLQEQIQQLSSNLTDKDQTIQRIQSEREMDALVNNGAQQAAQENFDKLRALQQEYAGLGQTHQNTLQQFEECKAKYEQQKELREQFFTKWTNLVKQNKDDKPLVREIEAMQYTIDRLGEEADDRKTEYQQLYDCIGEWNCDIAPNISSTMEIDIARDHITRIKATRIFLQGISQQLRSLRTFQDDRLAEAAAERAAQLEIQRQQALENVDGDLDRMISGNFGSLLGGSRGTEPMDE